MSDTGFSTFNKAVEHANVLLKDIEQTCGWKNHRNQSYAALRAVLHTLRDRLTVEQGAHLGSQLPMLIKGMYYEGYNPSHLPQKMNRSEFVDAVQDKFAFQVAEGTEALISQIVHVLGRHLDPAILRKVVAQLPGDLQPLFSHPTTDDTRAEAKLTVRPAARPAPAFGESLENDVRRGDNF